MQTSGFGIGTMGLMFFKIQLYGRKSMHYCLRSPSLVVMLILFGSQQCSIRNTAGGSNKFQIGLGGCALYVLILIERDEHE